MSVQAEVAGEPPLDEPVQLHNVNAGYPNVVGLRLASGRYFTDSEVAGALPVAVVNERFARTRLNGRSPLGVAVRVPRVTEPPFAAETDTFQIVGVVHDTVNAGLGDPIMPELHVPFTILGNASLLAVRTTGHPASVTRSVISQVYAIDPAQPVMSVATLDEVHAESEYATPRFNFVLLSVFAGIGLALAVVGVYGVMSSSVAQETPDIGVRVALGASAGTILRMVMGRGLRLLAAGTALGLVASYAAGRCARGWSLERRRLRPGRVRRGHARASRGGPPGMRLAGAARCPHRSADRNPV